MGALDPMVEGFAVARAACKLTLTSDGARGYF